MCWIILDLICSDWCKLVRRVMRRQVLKKLGYVFLFFFFFKQKTAYEMRISDRSSDVCSSDLLRIEDGGRAVLHLLHDERVGRTDHASGDPLGEIGRASCRERVCQYV